MRLLRVFECAARHGSFSLAAEELFSSQPSVSRSVAELEQQLGTKLFERVHRGVRLTRSGEMYREAVAAGLSRIGEAGAMLAWASTRHVVIACGHAVSTMFLLRLRKDLYRALGAGDTHIHILTCDYDLLGMVSETEADIVITCEPGGGRRSDRVVVFGEAVAPVCSPAYAREHAEVLGRPVAEWGGLTFLHVSRPNRGWATWNDWFDVAGRPRGRPRTLNYHDYVYLVEDAVDGAGLALGWRCLVDRHLDLGNLVVVSDGFVAFDRAHYARLTERGRHCPEARRCLEFFADRAPSA